jgi:hypothetical protein
MAVIEGPFPDFATDQMELVEGMGVAQSSDDNVIDFPRPPQEGVFDAGEIQYKQGEVSAGRSVIEWEIAVPQNLSHDGMAFFSPGYSGVYGSSKAPVDAAAAEGIITVRMKPGRKGRNFWEDMTKPQKLHVEGIEAVAADIATRTDLKDDLPNLGEIDPHKKLILAHSMGLLAALLYAQKHPNEVQMVFGYAGCGLGHPTMGEVIPSALKGAIPGMKHEIVPSIREGDIAASAENIFDLFHYWRHPRVIAEGLSCTVLDLIPTALRIQNEGVLVAQQAYELDSLVKADPKVAEYVGFHEILPNRGHMAPMRKAALVAGRMATTVHSVN